MSDDFRNRMVALKCDLELARVKECETKAAYLVARRSRQEAERQLFSSLEALLAPMPLFDGMVSPPAPAPVPVPVEAAPSSPLSSPVQAIGEPTGRAVPLLGSTLYVTRHGDNYRWLTGKIDSLGNWALPDTTLIDCEPSCVEVEQIISEQLGFKLSILGYMVCEDSGVIKLDIRLSDVESKLRANALSDWFTGEPIADLGITEKDLSDAYVVPALVGQREGARKPITATPLQLADDLWVSIGSRIASNGDQAWTLRRLTLASDFRRSNPDIIPRMKQDYQPLVEGHDMYLGVLLRVRRKDYVIGPKELSRVVLKCKEETR